MATLKTRIGLLEHKWQHFGLNRRCAFPSLEAAEAAGATGAIFIIPETMDAAKWDEMAIKRMRPANSP